VAQQHERPTALVTGVGRRHGIGAAICRTLATNGWNLCFTWWGAADRANAWGDREEFGNSFGAELELAGCHSLGIEADLSDVATPAVLVAECRARSGEITLLVNNAAVSEEGGIDDVTAESIDRHFAVNVRGMMLLTQAFVRQFESGSGGRIVNLTSGQSLGPMTGELAYAASKGAVEVLTTSLAPELMSRGITINAVNPGPTDNGWMSDDVRAMLLERAPAGRLGTAEDAARLVAFLASPEAEWITGQIIHSEGGVCPG
jgi:3-oxoacyl-[acyl-carrier protein] reductase